MTRSVAQTLIYYRDDQAGNWTLTASSFNLAYGTINVIPGAFMSLQVLLPGQTADPGHPTADPIGILGNPSSAVAGSPVQVTLNAVDAYFNRVLSIDDPLTLTLTDPAAPAGGTVNLSGGTAIKPVTFYSPGNQAVTATDTVTGPKTGSSGLLTILGGTASTLLDIVHNSPILSGEGLGAVGVTFMNFKLSVQSGQNPIRLDSLTLHARDSSGNDVPLDTAFQNLKLISGPQIFILPLSSVNTGIVSLAPLSAGITFDVAAASPITLNLTGDISSTATARNISLSVDASASVVAHDPVSAVSAAVVATGDPTGFPMVSGLLVSEPSDVSKTYGNYPNPFRPGIENTTIEFYLPAPSSVSLILYDVLGNKVLTLLKGQNLPTGLQRLVWDGRNGSGAPVISGIYYAQLTVNGTSYLVKVAVVR